MGVLVLIFVVMMILLLPRFIGLLPYLADSFLRARGSSALENSVRVSRDRNVIAAAMLIPAVFLVFRYRLYDASFLSGREADVRLLMVAGVLAAYLLLRLFIYLILRPARRREYYQIAHHTSYTFFILMMLLELVTAGLLSVFGVPEPVLRTVLYAETAVAYLSFFLRRAQILSLICNPLQTFLYLCALEIIPTAALVVSAVVL